MKLVVYGLAHLGCVTAACAAASGHEVVAVDPDAARVAALARGELPIVEPGLDALVSEQLASDRLRFTANLAEALGASRLLWITFDTPIDAQDRADVGAVTAHVERAFPHLASGSVVLVSSQLPVGTTRALAARHRASFPDRRVAFACSPENLRLGAAIRCFREPDRVVIGVDDEMSRGTLAELFAPITERIEWMSVASAEMTKHGLNAFLATSVVFANELAAICERVGADAREVARGLTSDARIGPRAYLSPGAAFTGGTLARDLGYLRERARETGAREALWSTVLGCNDAHQRWSIERIEEALGDGLGGRAVAVLGLAYKPGTDAIAHSAALGTALTLARRGASVRAFDPSVPRLPDEAARAITLFPSLDAAVAGADVVAILTTHASFRELDLEALARSATPPAIVDPGGVLATRTIPARLRYVRFGAVCNPAP